MPGDAERADARASRSRPAADFRTAEEVRARVRVAQRDVDQARRPSSASSPIKRSGSARSGRDGSSRVGSPGRVGPGASNGHGTPRPSGPFRVRDAVEDVQPGGQDEARGALADAGDDLADEPRPVLERAAVLARARPGGQQLVQEVAMALLEVDEIEAGPSRQRGRLDVPVLQAVELGVGDEGKSGPAVGAGGLVDDRPRIQQRVVLGEDRPLAQNSGRNG